MYNKYSAFQLNKIYKGRLFFEDMGCMKIGLEEKPNQTKPYLTLLSCESGIYLQSVSPVTHIIG